MMIRLAMRARRLRWMVLGLALPISAQAQIRTGPKAAKRIVIANVTVVDVERGRGIPAQTVVIEGTRIVSVGGPMRSDPAAQVVDGRSLFVIPGLWDMHTHVLDPGGLRAPPSFPLLLANGITGVRNMHSNAALSDIQALKRRVSAGEVLGPRMIIASPMLDGPLPMWETAVAVKDSLRARLFVDSLVNAGAELLKVYSYLPRAVYLAIATRARERGIPFAGHVPFGELSASDAANAGQRSIEHLEGVIEECSGIERDLRVQWRSIQAQRSPGWADSARFVRTWAMLRRAALSYNSATCDRLLKVLVDRGTWQTPTFVSQQVVSRAGDAAYLKDSLFRYAPESRAEREMISRMLSAAVNDAKATESGTRRIVREMQRKGVGLLAGSDTPSGGILPGFSLHDELAAFVEAGLTPAEALRTATLNPARYLGATDSLGTIKSGNVADLVLLEADPLLDIRNTRRIHSVIVNGRLLNREALNAMLRSAARESR